MVERKEDEISRVWKERQAFIKQLLHFYGILK
jgi:hypothetical protein